MDVVILGAGGHGKVVLDIVRCAGQYRVCGFLDADTTLADSQISGVDVIGQMNLLPKLKHQKIRGAIVAIGDNRIRANYAARVLEAGLELINAVHPSAVVSATASIGRNVVIAAGAIVCADAILSDSVIANTACVIDHEVEIGEASHICPGALLAGRVRVGRGAFVGLGAKVLPCLTIGDGAIVGAGATVISDVVASATVVGIPARPLRKAA
jgi:UDP-perosamine 4-acetyltransferase